MEGLKVGDELRVHRAFKSNGREITPGSLFSVYDHSGGEVIRLRGMGKATDAVFAPVLVVEVPRAKLGEHFLRSATATGVPITRDLAAEPPPVSKPKRRGRYTGRKVGKDEAVQILLRHLIGELDERALPELFVGEDWQRNQDTFESAIASVRTRLMRQVRA